MKFWNQNNNKNLVHEIMKYPDSFLNGVDRDSSQDIYGDDPA